MDIFSDRYLFVSKWAINLSEVCLITIFLSRSKVLYILASKTIFRN